MQLSRDKRVVFGTDAELARRRAEWVKKGLVNDSNSEKYRKVLDYASLISAGPLHLDKPNEKDRRVEVRACWKQKRLNEEST